MEQEDFEFTTQAVAEPVAVAASVVVEETEGSRIERTQRAIITYKPDANLSGKGLRLFIRNGEVMNPDSETRIRAGIDDSSLSAISVRVSGQPLRNLMRVIVEG